MSSMVVPSRRSLFCQYVGSLIASLGEVALRLRNARDSIRRFAPDPAGDLGGELQPDDRPPDPADPFRAPARGRPAIAAPKVSHMNRLQREALVHPPRIQFCDQLFRIRNAESAATSAR